MLASGGHLTPLAKSLAITGARCVCHLGLRARSARTLSCLQETRRPLSLCTRFLHRLPPTAPPRLRRGPRTPISQGCHSAIAYDVLHVVHYFAGAKVEDNLTQRWRRLHSRPAVGGMKANVLRSVRCLPARTVPGTKEEATSPSSMDGVASLRDGNERR